MDRFFCVFLSVLLVLNFFIPQSLSYAERVLNLPVPGSTIDLSPAFTPITPIGITIYPHNPLLFDLIVHPGDESLNDEQFQRESKKLIKYFLASLTVPEEEMWVNLSPYEKDRIVSKKFGQTEMGRDLLAQDYILKQLTASLMSPESELGNEFWDRIYKKANEKYNTSEIPMNAFNKVWIVPGKASLYENGRSVFVVESRLKVMLEKDYLALESNVDSTRHGIGDVSNEQLMQISDMSSRVIRDIILPEIEKEVNEGKTFAKLRQIYHSMILARWYKDNLGESLLGQVYVNQNKTKGIDLKDKSINQKIYAQYVASFQKGVFNFIKEDYDPISNDIIPRKYFSGGVNLEGANHITHQMGNLKQMLSVSKRVEIRTDGLKDGAMISPPENSVGFIEYTLAEFPVEAVSIERMIEIFKKDGPANVRLDISPEDHPSAEQLKQISQLVSNNVNYEISLFQQRSTGAWFAVKRTEVWFSSRLKETLIAYDDLSYQYYIHPGSFGQVAKLGSLSIQELIVQKQYGDSTVGVIGGREHVYVYLTNGVELEKHVVNTLGRMQWNVSPRRSDVTKGTHSDEVYFQKWKKYLEDHGYSIERYPWENFTANEDEIYANMSFKTDDQVLENKHNLINQYPPNMQSISTLMKDIIKKEGYQEYFRIRKGVMQLGALRLWKNVDYVAIESMDPNESISLVAFVDGKRFINMFEASFVKSKKLEDRVIDKYKFRSRELQTYVDNKKEIRASVGTYLKMRRQYWEEEGRRSLGVNSENILNRVKEVMIQKVYDIGNKYSKKGFQWQRDNYHGKSYQALMKRSGEKNIKSGLFFFFNESKGALKAMSGMMETIAGDYDDQVHQLFLGENLYWEVPISSKEVMYKVERAIELFIMRGDLGYIDDFDEAQLGDNSENIKQFRTSTPGGIDLNPNILDLEKKGQRADFDFRSNVHQIQHFNIDGIVPVIINISPIKNIPLILGVSQSNEQHHIMDDALLKAKLSSLSLE